MKYSKTTLWGFITAAATFVALNHDLFPSDQGWGTWAQRLSAFVATGALAKAFKEAKDDSKGSDRPQELVDQKLDNVPPAG